MPSDADRGARCDHHYRWRLARDAYMDAVITGRTTPYPWHIFPRAGQHPWRDGWYCSACGAKAPDEMVALLVAEEGGRTA